MFIIDAVSVDVQAAFNRPLNSSLDRVIDFTDEKGREWKGIVTPFTRSLFRDYWVYLEYKGRVYICVFEMVSLAGLTVGPRYRIPTIKECENLKGDLVCVNMVYNRGLMVARDIPEVLFTMLCGVIGNRNARG